MFRLLLILLLAPGCASLPGYTTTQSRSDYLKKHPEAPQYVQDAINKGQISKGMTKEQVKAAWGSPSSVNQTSDPNGTVEVWNYFGHNFLYFYGDKLSYWSQTNL